MIQLEPSKWIGKELPLKTRVGDTEIEIEQVMQGERKVILIHADCRKCLNLLDELQEQNADNVVFIEVPSYSNAPLPSTSFPLFKLDARNDWFVTAPCIVETSDSICKKVYFP